jgi:hypothetical protein
LRHQENAIAFAGEQADTDKLPGQQLIVVVVELGAQGLGAQVVSMLLARKLSLPALG